jgi:hypothetical protein
MTDEQYQQITARLDRIEKALAALQKPDDWIARLDPRKPFDSTADAAGTAPHKPAPRA